MNLYDIAREYREACDKLADLDLDAQTISDTLDGMSGELEVKATSVVAFTRGLEALSTAIKAEEDRLAKRRKALDTRAAALSTYVLNCMQASGLQKIEGPRFKLSIAKNPLSVDVFDADQLPAQYMTRPKPPEPVPDKLAIKAALTMGADVPGARLQQGNRLKVD